jgi:DNA primase
MREVLDRAEPLVEFLWTLESTAHPLDTPERRAALERRLQERASGIADRSVREHYDKFLRERVFQYFGNAAAGRDRAWRPARRVPRGRPASVPAPYEPAPQAPSTLRRRQEEVLLAVLLNHPGLLEAVAEELAELEFESHDLDRLSRELLHLHAARSDLDAGALQLHLSQGEFAAIVNSLLAPQVLNHASFARREADPEVVRAGWHSAKEQFLMRRRKPSVGQAENAGELTQEWWERLKALHEQREDAQKTDGGVVG